MAQPAWAALPVRVRLAAIARLRGAIAADAAGLAALLRASAIDPALVAVLDESVAAAQAAMAAGIDKVFLTGSVETGRAVLQRLAATVTPAVMELSGEDPVFVLPGADLGLVAEALAFALRFNGGATCIAPRRVFVPAPLHAELANRLTGTPTLMLVPVASAEQALAIAGRSPYALGAARVVHGRGLHRRLHAAGRLALAALRPRRRALTGPAR
jgi:acyl-CoA reductase-like NAD-dependent aldehyde dehydrogenase